MSLSSEQRRHTSLHHRHSSPLRRKTCAVCHAGSVVPSYRTFATTAINVFQPSIGVSAINRRGGVCLPSIRGVGTLNDP